MKYVFSLFLLLSSYVGYAQISGTVYRDFNSNGAKDNSGTFNEPGLAGITVKAYDASGAQVGGDQTTNATGAYSFSGLTLPVRVEFENLATGDFSGFQGSGSGTSVQFVSAASTAINFGVNYPSDYCQTDPNIMTPCYVSGDPLVSGVASQQDALVMFPYSSSGTTSNSTYLAKGLDIGSTWGIAYQRSEERVFAATTLKRHVGLGTSGIGGIYVTTDVFGTPTTSEFVDVVGDLSLNVGTVISNAARGLVADITAPSNDATVYDQIGKVGIGDIDISDDQTTMWFVNIFDNTLNSLEIDSDNNFATKPSAADLETFSIPSSCTGGALRTWGVKYYKTKVYVGGVCDAETSQNTDDLKGIVYEFDGTSFTEVLSFDLDYFKEQSIGGSCANAADSNWFPWLSTLPASCQPTGYARPIYTYPQAILSDIEFDINGDMIIGLMDRMASQQGFANYPPTGTTNIDGISSGDIIRAEKSGSTFTIETITGPDADDESTEFYDGDVYVNSFFATTHPAHKSHRETAQGGIALLPGLNEVLSTSMDPVDGNQLYERGGIIYLNNTTGDKDDAYQVYVNADGFFGKANGLGDAELLCNPAPIEIGNRIWKDLDLDGVQDADEVGIDDVEIELVEGSTVVGTATSADGGQWYFNSANVTGGLKANTDYTIRVKTALDTDALAGCTGFTIKDAATGGEQDLGDSDAETDGTIAYRTGNFGENDHTLDIGVALVTEPCPYPNCAGVTVIKN